MVTLGRFKALAGSYGADLQRWPESLRGEAQALLAVSPQARQSLAEARMLDEAIGAAQGRQDALLWPPGEHSASLARLRSGVAARIAPLPARRARLRIAPGWGAWVLSMILGRAGTAASGGIAVVAGLLIGALHAPVPASGNLLAMLQPAPLQILANVWSQND